MCLKGLAKNADVYLSDVTKPIRVELKSKYEIFIHLAAANDVESLDPCVALNSTVLGTRNCLDFCIKNGIKKVIYFSTFQVYGTNRGFVNEATDLHCANDYAMTHRFAEEYVEMYRRNFGLEYIILRPTNVYGACLHKDIDRWSLVPNCFCKEAIERQTITLLSSGRQLRDFISLEDLTNLTVILCGKFNKVKNSVINLAAGRSISILDVAQMVKASFEKILGTTCALNIQSSLPRKAERLTVETKRLKGLGYRFDKEYSIEKEIERIFCLLKADN